MAILWPPQRLVGALWMPGCPYKLRPNLQVLLGIQAPKALRRVDMFYVSTRDMNLLSFKCLLIDAQLRGV